MEKTQVKENYSKLWGRISLIVLSLLLIFGLYKLAIFYIPFIIALIISAIAEPFIKLIMKVCKIKRKLASVIALFLITLLIFGLLTLLISSLVTESMNLITNLGPHVDNLYKFVTGFIDNFEMGNLVIPPQAEDIFNNSLSALFSGLKTALFNLMNGIINIFTSLPTLLTNIFITILAVFFICMDKEVIFSKVRHHLPTKWIKSINNFISTALSATFKYIKAEAKLSLLCFVMVLSGLTIMDWCGLGVTYPVIWALFIGFVDILPLFGAGAVMIPWAIYLGFTGNVPLAIAIVCLWIVWAILKQLLEPKVLSKEIGIHPIFTLVAMYTGFKLGGVLGLIFAPIILLILVNIFSKTVEKGVIKTILDEE